MTVARGRREPTLVLQRRGSLRSWSVLAATVVVFAALAGSMLTARPIVAQERPAEAEPLAQTPLVRAEQLPAPVHSAEFREGVALGLHFVDEETTYAPYLWEIALTGADSVSLVFAWTQQDVRATTIAPTPNTPSDAALRRAIRDAKSLGLDVMILPILQLQTRAQGEWRGTLAPDDVDAWFAAYGAFIGHYAALAQEEGVALMSVGSELGSMERYEQRWRGLIAQVREAFSGELTYSANWDHYFNTPFWDALDIAGLTAYYELAEAANSVTTVQGLVEAWTPFVESLRAFALGVGLPVILTEVGYVSQLGAAAAPWDYTSTGAPDLAAQLELYAALYLAWYDEDWLGGVFVWNWFGDGGSSDNGYTPRLKPAEQVLRHWYGGAVSGE